MSTISTPQEAAGSGLNPLAKYFRVPGLHVTLPTNGAFFPEGTIEFLPDGTLPILPMRAADELLLKNPDALMSGFAIEKLIESCAPGIKSPRLISAPDLDVVLLAIRAATYGNEMEIQATCPQCNHQNNFDCDLGAIINNITPVPLDSAVRLTDDIIAYLRPYNLESTTALSLATFTETRKVQAMEYDESFSEDAKQTQMNTSMETLSALNSDLISRCITRIVTPDGEVTEPRQIAEFYANIARKWTKMIEDKLDELNSAGIEKKIKVRCERTSCQNEWTTTVEFDPTSFFASGSSD